MLRKLSILFALFLGSVCIANAQSAASISASAVSDSFGHPIKAAKLCFAPVDATGTATGFRVGSVQVVATPVCGVVSNGILQSGLSVEPTPAGIYYRISAQNYTTGSMLRDYGMTQITGSSWSLDSYDPSTAVLPVTALSMGTVTTLPSGSGASCNLSGSSPTLLNCSIPRGADGAGTIAGLAGDGANGINVTGNVAAGKVGSVLYAGTTQYPTITSAIAGLPSTGGTVRTPPGYTESVSTLDIGTSTKPVTLVAGQGTLITITGGNGTTGLRLFNGSALLCEGSAGTGCTLKSSQTTPLSLLSNGQQDGTQEYFLVRGWSIDCGSTVTFTNGCVDINGAFVPSGIEDSMIFRFSNSIGLHIHTESGTSGGTNVFLVSNTWVNGGSNTGAQPVVIDRSSAGVVSQIQFIGGAIEHPGLGLHDLTINGNGSTFQLYGIAFYGTQFEGTTSNTVADAYIVDVQKVGLYDINCSHHYAVPCVELNQTVSNGLDSVFATNLRGGTSGPVLQNDVTGYATPLGQYLLPEYHYAATTNAAPAVFDGPTNFRTPADYSQSAYNPASLAGANMLVAAGIDPSFEAASTGWTTQSVSDSLGSFTRDGTTAAPGLGTYSEKVTVGTSSGSDQLHATNASWSLTSGQSYTISFWAKNDGGSVQGVMTLQNAATTVTYCPLQYLPLTSTWKFFVFSCTAAASGTDVMLRLANRVSSGTGSIWYDGAYLGSNTTPPYPGFSSLAQSSVDGATLVNNNGIVSCTTATASQLGCVKPDGTTITAAGGVLSTVAAVPPKTLCAYNTRSTGNTGSTTEANVYSCAIPANTLGLNSRIAVKAFVLSGATQTGTCSLRVRWSTTSGSVSGSDPLIGSSVVSGNFSNGWDDSTVYNTNSLTAQSANYAGYGNSGGNQVSNASASINTGTTQAYVVINLTNSVSGDTCYVNSATVTLWP